MIKTSLLVVSTFVLFARAEFDCKKGCSLDPTLMGPKVCGADGLSYANECLASCQGIDLDSLGPCDDPVDEYVIDGATMSRFEDEDFRFITKRTRYASEIDYSENITDPDEDITNEIGEDRYFVRITSEGYEYASRYSSLNDTVGPTTAYKGFAEGYEYFVKTRNLFVLGNDTRARVSDSKMFPKRAIGAVDMSWGENACTATMISRTSALTAGHSNAHDSNSPGRQFDLATNNPVDPFGTWEVDYMTMFGAYRDMRIRFFDMAVVTYKPINRPDLGCAEVFPGDLVGFVAIDSVAGTETEVTDPRIANITITGYPYDFRRGEMTTSGPCSPPASSNGEHYIKYYCDTTGGMSGSALLTSDNIALGNHAGGAGSFNVGPVMSKDMFDAVYSWAGLGNTTQYCMPVGNAVKDECPCSRGGNPWNQVLCWFLNIQGCIRVARQNASQL